MLHTLRFSSSKCRLFHNATFFGSCIIHILHTGCAKIYIPNSGAKRLNLLSSSKYTLLSHRPSPQIFLESSPHKPLCSHQHCCNCKDAGSMFLETVPCPIMTRGVTAKTLYSECTPPRRPRSNIQTH